MKLVCAKCNYRFEREKLEDCPYCGEKNVKKEPSASELIDEVADMLEE